MGIIANPSPNFGDRRRGAIPDLIVLHYTAMASASAALSHLCDPGTEVSAHYLICARGDVYQLVPEEMRAWHAGVGQWGACTDVNSRSVGIELVNDGFSPFSARQTDALVAVMAGIQTRWNIPPERIIGHSDMAFPRKIDPGTRFDWRALALHGLSIWPDVSDPQVPDIELFSGAAQEFGYAERGNFADLLQAVRLRFRPWGTGALDGIDMALITDLARRFPVDRNALNT